MINKFIDWLFLIVVISEYGERKTGKKAYFQTRLEKLIMVFGVFFMLLCSWLFSMFSVLGFLYPSINQYSKHSWVILLISILISYLLLFMNNKHVKIIESIKETKKSFTDREIYKYGFSILALFFCSITLAMILATQASKVPFW